MEEQGDRSTREAIELNLEKKRLRKELLAKRDALSKEEQIRAQVLITERILGHQWYYLSDTLLAFVSYGSEINTLEIVSEALRIGKKVFVPKIVPKEHDEAGKKDEMLFFQIRSLEELQPGYKGIPEPDGLSERYVYDEEKTKRTLLLMPGVGFDPYGNRMGYGKGFYDRFLEDKEKLILRSIAIGHACQRTECIPMEEKDVKPYQVILV